MGDWVDNTPELFRSLPEGIVVERLNNKSDPARETSGTPNAQTASVSDSIRGSGLKAILKNSLRPFLRLLTETPDKNYGWAKLAAKRGSFLAKEHNAQVVFSSGPPHSTHLAALAISKQCKIPLVTDLRDPWGRKPWRNHDNPLRDYVLPWYESRAVRGASQVILNTESSLIDFQKYYPSQSSKFSCIPNGLDAHLVDQVAKLQKQPSSHPFPVFIHPGNLYGHRDPVPLIKAVAKLRDQGKRIAFRQVGSIDPHYNTEAIVKELGLQGQVFIEPPMSHGHVLQAMRNSDALVIIQPDAPFMVPAKVFEMMAFDQPILSVSDSPCTEAIVRRSGGACAPSRDVEGIAASIERILDMLSSPELQAARDLARTTYDAKRLTGQLAHVFNRSLT